jgi:hypothetical protein
MSASDERALEAAVEVCEQRGPAAEHDRVAEQRELVDGIEVLNVIWPGCEKARSPSNRVDVNLRVNLPDSTRCPSGASRDSACDLSCPNSTRRHQVDEERKTTDLAVGGSNPFRRATLALAGGGALVSG